MNIVVSTSKAVFLVDIFNNRTQIIHEGSGLYYGITYTDNDLFIAARNNFTGDRISQQSEAGSILKFDISSGYFDREIKAPFPLRDLHQISIHDGILYLTCSYDNKIVIYDFNRWFEWYPNREITNGGVDRNHLNSFLITDSYIYLAAHNLDKPSEIWCFRNKTKIKLILNRLFGIPLRYNPIKTFTLGKCIHNITKYQGQLITLNSQEGLVCGSKGFKFITGMFPRGLAICENYIFIGLSEFTERKNRDFTNSYLCILHKDWKVLKILKFEEMGLLLDIQTPGYKNDSFQSYMGKKLPFKDTKKTVSIPEVLEIGELTIKS